MILGKGLVYVRPFLILSLCILSPLPVAWAALSRPSRSSSSPGLHSYVLHYSASLSKQEPDSISRQSSTESVSIQERSTKKEASMLARHILSAALLAFALTSPVTARAAENDGIVRIKSAYSMPETIKLEEGRGRQGHCSSTRSINPSSQPMLA